MSLDFPFETVDPEEIDPADFEVVQAFDFVEDDDAVEYLLATDDGEYEDDLGDYLLDG